MIVRKATLDDLEVLIKFEQAIILAERPFDTTLKADPISYYDLKELVLSEKAEVLVAEFDTKVIGSGYALIQPSLPYVKHDYHSHLGFMYVLPQYRGKGVNKHILEGLINWSQSQGVCHVRLEVYAENHSAIRAYQKYGFTNNLVEMCLSISED